MTNMASYLRFRVQNEAFWVSDDPQGRRPYEGELLPRNPAVGRIPGEVFEEA